MSTTSYTSINIRRLNCASFFSQINTWHPLSPLRSARLAIVKCPFCPSSESLYRWQKQRLEKSGGDFPYPAASCSFLLLSSLVCFLISTGFHPRVLTVREKNMTSCELCRSPATMFCASDQASLCWVCDSEVHSANFLVARHSRSLLCQVCQLPTPWSASGAKLGQTVSVCKNCVGAADRVLSGGALFQLPTPPDGGGCYDDTDDEDALVVDADDDDSDDDDDDDEEEAEEGDGTDYDEEERENQVVPWFSTPPPPVTSSSSSEESSNGFGNADRSLKRKHEGCSDLPYQVDLGR